MFGAREFYSVEEYDIAKFLDFKVDVYDVINSPFLEGLRELPVEKYYVVEGGNKDLDIIAQEVYGSAFLAYYIQFYNDMDTEYALEGSKLKLFSPTDLNDLANSIYTNY